MPHPGRSICSSTQSASDPQKVPFRTLQLMECAWRSIMDRCCRSAPSASAD
jgi:hypothetical protein